MDTAENSWAMALGSLSGLRLKKSQELLEGGDAAGAIIEAEELLDEEPDHLEALLLVGDAALDLSEYFLAEDAFSRAMELAPESPLAFAGLGIAVFESARLEEAIRLLQRALSHDRSLTEAWYYLGLALERSKQPAEAAKAYAEAAAARPDLYPLVTPFPDEIVASALERAWRLLPLRLQRWYEGITIEFRTLPDLELLTRGEEPLSPTSAALYLGEPPEDGDGWDERPERVLLFRSNLERIATLEQVSLASLIAEGLRLEALDWMGLELDALPLRD